MHKNVFFVSHAHREVGGGEDSVSKHNAYEVSAALQVVAYSCGIETLTQLDMIYDLVLHLLKFVLLISSNMATD